MPLTLEDVKDYLGIDYEDEQVTRNLERKIKVADKMLIGALGKNYPQEDERVHEVMLMVIDDLYSNRGINDDKVSRNTRRLFEDFLLQIRLEMREKGEQK